MNRKSNNLIKYGLITSICVAIIVLISFMTVLLVNSSASSNILKNHSKDTASFADNDSIEENGTNGTNSIHGTLEKDEPDNDVLDEHSSSPMNENYENESFMEDTVKEEDKGENLISYDGPTRHIFFHPLIAYPELAFDGDFNSDGFDDWFITVKEFNKILNSLYKNNYILININYMYEKSSDHDKKLLTKRDMMLPPGKKPLIISIDDNNYYTYMKQDGIVYKLILDSLGNVADFSITPDGKELVTKENDIIPIIDEFVKEHPDFSFRGAKGVIALTGYEGILGYRTDNPPAPNIEEEKIEAEKIIKRLKETGWTFACHGYGHLDAVKISYEKLKKDTERWKDEVEPLIGETPVYIFPFGSGVLPNTQKSDYLRDAGFPIMCAVGNNDYIDYAGDVIYMDRIHIDGRAFKDHMPVLKEMFEIDEIIDEIRPWVKR